MGAVFRNAALREEDRQRNNPAARLPTDVADGSTKRVAAKSGLPADVLLRKGRPANVVNARDRFIREAVLEQGYLASQVANFLVCHPSNVSRALQKS
jgi:hypothetical protein